ncbi:hypothetical protein GCM10025857_59010 [Alicyclobacillus contaminans]|nr:hypothetical protein GCM10025857_59010 [Alicyclobacillus contaminans]
MNQCMSIVEKSLTRKISHSQWVMLDASYGLIYDIYQRRLQKEVLIGVIDDGSLEAEEIMRFIKQSLAGMANITIKKPKSGTTICWLLRMSQIYNRFHIHKVIF